MCNVTLNDKTHSWLKESGYQLKSGVEKGMVVLLITDPHGKEIAKLSYDVNNNETLVETDGDCFYTKTVEITMDAGERNVMFAFNRHTTIKIPYVPKKLESSEE